MRTPQQVIQWAHDNPLNTGAGGPLWDNDCVAFVRRSGDFPVTNTASTANLARAKTLQNGHTLEPTATPPLGWFVWFDGPTPAGHVGMSVGGGKFLSATTFERDPDFGPALGVMRISDYDRIPGVTYKGAGPWFINLTLDLSSAIGGDGDLITEPRSTSMPRIFVDSSTLSSGGAPVGTTVWAQAGSAPLTPGNWWEVTDATHPGVRSDMQAAHGDAIQLDHATFLARRTAYLIGAVSGGGGGGLTPAQDAKLMAIPSADADTVDEAEAGQLATSGAQLVINDLTPKIAAMKAAVDGLTLTHN